jgi:hypothetical protein
MEFAAVASQNVADRQVSTPDRHKRASCWADVDFAKRGDRTMQRLVPKRAMHVRKALTTSASRAGSLFHPSTEYPTIDSFTWTFGSAASACIPCFQVESMASSSAFVPRCKRKDPMWSSTTGTFGCSERNAAASASCDGLHCKSNERLCSARRGKFFAKVASTGDKKFLTVRGQVARSTVGVSPGWSAPSCQDDCGNGRQRQGND